jgi:hypothetical protein
MGNKGDTIMLLPGDPSVRAKILERTSVSTYDPTAFPVVPPVAVVENPPTSGNEQFGFDVTQWQTIEAFHFTNELDAWFHGAKVTITPWYWYATPTFHAPYAYNMDAASSHGVWVAGKDVKLAIDGTFDATAQFVTYSTNNADRMFLQIKEYHNGVAGAAVPWYKQCVFGLVPRPADGASVYAAVVDVNDAGDAPSGGGGGGGGVGTGEVVVYNSTGAAAINLTTAEIDAFELVAVTIHLSVAPTTAGNILVTLNAADGAAYDTVLLTLDPSTYLGGVTNIAWKPESRFFFEPGDQVVVSYPNTDIRTYGARIVIAR